MRFDRLGHGPTLCFASAGAHAGGRGNNTSMIEILLGVATRTHGLLCAPNPVIYKYLDRGLVKFG